MSRSPNKMSKSLKSMTLRDSKEKSIYERDIDELGRIPNERASNTGF